MAYEEEIDFQPIEQAIQDDLVSNALDVTSTPLTEDTEATVQVTAVEQGIPRMRRMRLDWAHFRVMDSSRLILQN